MDPNCKTLVVDIDGVLTIEKHGHAYLRRTPNTANIRLLTSLREKGHVIILHTSRTFLDWDITMAWLKQHQVPHDLVVFGKPIGDFYVDDKNAVSLGEVWRELSRVK